MVGRASITAATGRLQKGREVSTGSPLTLLPPHSNLSRATQVLAKERENRVNLKTDKKILNVTVKVHPD